MRTVAEINDAIDLLIKHPREIPAFQSPSELRRFRQTIDSSLAVRDCLAMGATQSQVAAELGLQPADVIRFVILARLCDRVTESLAAADWGTSDG